MAAAGPAAQRPPERRQPAQPLANPAARSAAVLLTAWAWWSAGRAGCACTARKSWPCPPPGPAASIVWYYISGWTDGCQLVEQRCTNAASLVRGLRAVRQWAGRQAGGQHEVQQPAATPPSGHRLWARTHLHDKHVGQRRHARELGGIAVHLAAWQGRQSEAGCGAGRGQRRGRPGGPLQAAAAEHGATGSHDTDPKPAARHAQQGAS